MTHRIPKTHRVDWVHEANEQAALLLVVWVACLPAIAGPWPQRETCLACGCLCLADEECPGCRARRG